MGKTVAIANQKGGVGKTTTAVNLCASLAYRGQRVLLVDCDPQSNATTGFGLDKTRTKGVYDVMFRGLSARDAVIATRFGSIIGASPDLAGANVELVDVPGREFVLMHKLKSLKENFDYIFIDCPPSLELLTLNALVAADTVMVPSHAARPTTTDFEAALREHFPGLVYETTIPRNVRLSEAPSHGEPCLAYDKSSKGARAYLHLANEFLKAQRRGRG